ncbi:MAG TPA: penicillin-binding protein 2 [Acidimicrobiales bacterium]
MGSTSRTTTNAVGEARARHRDNVAHRRAVEAERRRPPNHRKRLLVVLAVLAGLFGVLATKVVDLQVVSPSRYLAFGESQRHETQVLAANRGAILDRNGDELAVSRPTRSVFVDPALIEDAPTAAAAVAPILGLTVEEVQVKMTGNGRFSYLKRKVPSEVADKVEALTLPGVAFLDESERYLPGGDAARSLLGRVDIDNAGLSGLEAQYDQGLTGVPGELTIEKDPDGRTIPYDDNSVTPAQPGETLTLTIDRAIQYEAEQALSQQVATSEAKGGIAIVTKPGTGEVLAMANVVRDEKTGDVLVGTNNAALTTQYEPGSVIKPVTVAAALEEKVTDTTRTYYLPPYLQRYDYEFIEAEPRGAVTWNLPKILAQSSNVGTILVAEDLGGRKLYDYQRAFGFGETTDLEFPNEARGAVRDPSDWSGTDLPTIAIGQGISVTPMQMLMAYNVIANEGVYVAPNLLHSTTGADGVVHRTPVAEGRRVVSAETANQLNVMLRAVTTTGTGQLAKVDGYNVSGKTGTARKVQPNGTYKDEFGFTQYQSTFIGVVPAEQPALSVYVMIDEPKGQYTGGTTAAPAFSDIAGFSLRRLGIPPAATDIANGGKTVQEDGGNPVGVATVGADGRVRAQATSSAPTTPSTTVPHGGPSTSTTVPQSGSPPTPSTPVRRAG